MIRITNQFESVGRNFGNKLFTYAVGRIFAKELNQGLKIPENSLIQRKGINSLFPYGNVTGLYDYDDEYYVSDHSMFTKGIDLILNECKNKSVFLDGYFLKYDYIKKHKEYIKEIYSDLILENDNKNDVVILLRNSRCDDTFALPDSYYLEILENLNFDNLFVCYDHIDRHKTLIEAIKKYSPTYVDENIIDVFKFITSKNTIIACQGTFSFWSVLLSNSKKIYWPIPKKGPNVNENLVNLTIDDEDRIDFINVK